MAERLAVRILVAVALCLASMAVVLMPLPVDGNGDPDLPAPALGQRNLYRLEMALMVFYGDLLLVTPAYSGLVRGRLPIEISTRGAKFAEEADQLAARDKAAVEKLEETAAGLDRRLTDARLEIERLNKAVKSDSRQPKVVSKR